VDDRAHRIAENEALFRDLNEEVGVVAHAFSTGGEDLTFDFLCECGDATCATAVPLTVEAYEELRRSPVRFFVLPGHQSDDVEVVVEAHEHYLVVEKTGEAAQIARERDPRKNG
jgi:hypothetical protein